MRERGALGKSPVQAAARRLGLHTPIRQEPLVSLWLGAQLEASAIPLLQRHRVAQRDVQLP